MSRPSRDSLGMTLTEVMVYCILLSIFSMMVFLNLPQHTNATLVDLHEATTVANKALTRMTLEIGNASASSVSVTASPMGVMFLSGSSDGYGSFGYTSAGELAWRGWVGYFLDSTRLTRVWYPLPAPVARSAVSTPPTPATMLAGGTRTVVCDRVSRFVVSLPEANLWECELTLRVTGSEATLISGAGARN